MAWWTREDYVTRLEQFMARFYTSVRVICIPTHMISVETTDVMYKHVRHWHMYYVEMLMWHLTWGSFSHVRPDVCGRQATCQSSTRGIQSVVPNIHQIRHGPSPQRDIASTDRQGCTPARAHHMDTRRPWWSDVSSPGWRRQLWVSVRVSHLCICRGSENTYKNKNSKAQIFVEFQTSYKQLFNF